MEYFKQFQTHLEHNDLPSIVSLWQEYCLSDEIQPEETKKILEGVKESPLCDPFGCYVEQILPLWETCSESPAKHRVFCLVFDIQSTNAPELGEMAYDYLKVRFGTDQNFNKKIRLVGLRERESFRYCVSNFDILNHMNIGSFFLHTGGWGVGEVTDISLLREQVIMEFDYVAGQKDLSFTNAFKTLIPIPKTHFLAMRFGNPDELEKKAKTHPVQVIRQLLEDLGPKSAQEIRDELCDLVIPEKEWTRWWQTTRSKVKKDTMIVVPDQIKDPFSLRASEISHEERFQKELNTKPSARTLIEMVYAFMRDFPSALKNPEFKESLKNQLLEVLSQKELENGQEVEILFFLQNLDVSDRELNIAEMMQKFTNIETLIDEIAVLAHKKRLLADMRKYRDDWPAIFLRILFHVDAQHLKDYLLEELLSAKHEDMVVQKMEALLANPLLSPVTCLWYFQKIMRNDKLPFSNQEGKNLFFEAYFTLFYQLETMPAYRDLVKKMHQFLSAARYQNVRDIFRGASKAVVQEILLLSTKCQTLSDHDIKILYSLAEVVHPSLGKGKEDDSDQENQVVWTMPEGYQKLKERIHHIATVETVDNAKEIEIARSHGDLRENSEFKFALERRDRLQSELKFLSDQLNAMRILTEEEVNTHSISVGTIIDLKNASGRQTTYTLLGPWDAEPDNNILSFQSKLAQSLQGLSVGQTCHIQNEEWKIVKIRSVFEKKRVT